MIGREERNLLAQICKDASQDIVALANPDSEASPADVDAKEGDPLSNILLTVAATAESCAAAAVAEAIETIAAAVADTKRTVEQVEHITDWLSTLAELLFEDDVAACLVLPE